MSMSDVKAAREALVAMVTAEAGKHIRALQSLGCDVKVVYGEETIIDTFENPDALLPSRPRKRAAKAEAAPANFPTRRNRSHGARRDIAGMSGYIDKLKTLTAPGTMVTIMVPKGLVVADLLGPVYGRCSAFFGPGNYSIVHDTHSIVVERTA